MSFCFEQSSYGKQPQVLFFPLIKQACWNQLSRTASELSLACWLNVGCPSSIPPPARRLFNSQSVVYWELEMKILLGFRWLGEHLLCPAPFRRHRVCAGKRELKFSERGVVSEKCFMALQQWRRKASSSLRRSFRAQRGSAGSLVLLCVCYRCFHLQKRDTAAPRRRSGPVLWNTLMLYLGVCLKKMTNLMLWKAALKIIACNLSSGKYVLGDNSVAEVILHSWSVDCVVLSDLLWSAKGKRRGTFLSFRRKRGV